MEAYLADWLSLLLRWAHLVVGIAWIGASFFFIRLDNHLEPPKEEDRADPRIFKWAAYWTWITGFFLLVLIYYAGAELYLIDPAVMPLSKSVAIAVGIGSLIVPLVIYEAICRSPLADNDAALGSVMCVLLAGVAWGLCQVFGGRGAFIHYGAILGTIMAGNVAHVIIPGQRRMVAALSAGLAPDSKDSAAGRQRSAHNAYLTLPVLFAMISGHYAFTFAGRWNWLVLVALTLAGGLVSVWFVSRHKAGAPAWPLAAGIAVLFVAVLLLLPHAEEEALPVKFEEIRKIVDARCAGCHAAKPTFQGLNEAPGGIMLDTPERIRTQRGAILAQTVVSKAMPPGNLTAMTDAERTSIGRWIRSGARIE